MFDSKHFGLVDAVIAMEIAEKIDDGQPKQKLGDLIRRGLARIWQQGAETSENRNLERQVLAKQKLA